MLNQFSLFFISSTLSWVIATIPLYLASKLIVGERSTFLRSMFATFLGFIFFAIPEVIFITLTPDAIIFSVVAGIVALAMLSFIYGTIYSTSVGGGFIITVAAVLISFFIFIVVVVVFGLTATLFNLAVANLFSACLE